MFYWKEIHLFVQVYFKKGIESSRVDSITVKVGSLHPTVFFDQECAISNTSIGDILVSGGTAIEPAWVSGTRFFSVEREK